ncbi:MAG: hypothetical protein JSS49_27640 [Planctomycetes bacterium]|nr:hypothetical protein [Planctomycetota bacterium]
MKIRNNLSGVGAVLLALAVIGISGCGELSSGANTVPTVKYRADATAVADTESTATSTEATPAEAGGIGNLTGKVVVEGSFAALPPLFAKGAAAKDVEVCGAEAIPNEKAIVNDGRLMNVFVYLEKAPKGAKSAEMPGTVTFDQKTCIFLPHAMVVRTMQTVNILNDDAAAHNTHTYPKKNNQFNSVVPPNDRVGVPLKYDQTEKEPVKVGCDIHSWMEAYHLPLDHSFAAVSKADGTFEIKDLPAGKHEFKVWHEGKFLDKGWSVTIKPGDNDFTFTVAASKLGK